MTHRFIVRILILALAYPCLGGDTSHEGAVQHSPLGSSHRQQGERCSIPNIAKQAKNQAKLARKKSELAQQTAESYKVDSHADDSELLARTIGVAAGGGVLLLAGGVATTLSALSINTAGGTTGFAAGTTLAFSSFPVGLGIYEIGENYVLSDSSDLTGLSHILIGLPNKDNLIVYKEYRNTPSGRQMRQLTIDPKKPRKDLSKLMQKQIFHRVSDDEVCRQTEEFLLFRQTLNNHLRAEIDTQVKRVEPSWEKWGTGFGTLYNKKAIKIRAAGELLLSRQYEEEAKMLETISYWLEPKRLDPLEVFQY